MEYTEIIVSFYAPEDDYVRMRKHSYEPELTENEIADALFEKYGPCSIVGYEYY